MAAIVNYPRGARLPQSLPIALTFAIVPSPLRISKDLQFLEKVVSLLQSQRSDRRLYKSLSLPSLKELLQSRIPVSRSFIVSSSLPKSGGVCLQSEKPCHLHLSPSTNLGLPGPLSTRVRCLLPLEARKEEKRRTGSVAVRHDLTSENYHIPFPQSRTLSRRTMLLTET